MAYTKIVQGRSYPFLYNVSATVGSRKAIRTVPQFAAPMVPGVAESAYPGWTLPEQPQSGPVTTYTASYEPNSREDVMLVQYLLKRVHQQGGNVEPPLNGGAAQPAQLTIDGVYGPRTQGAIEHFQLEMRRNGRSIATDGAVDTEPGDSATSSISHTGYSISWLNKYFWVLWPALAPNIAMDPECPNELKLALSRGKVQ